MAELGQEGSYACDTVLVGQIHSLLAEIHRSQGLHLHDAAAAQVHYGHAVVFLQGHVGLAAADAHKLRLHVLSLSGASRAGNPDTWRQGHTREAQIRVAEAGGGGRVPDVDYSHRTVRIDAVIAAGLAFVGNHQLATIFTEGDAIRQVTHRHVLQECEGAVRAHAEETHHTRRWSGVVGGRHQRHRHQILVGRHRGAHVVAVGHPGLENRRGNVGGIRYLQGSTTAGGQHKQFASY